MFTLRFCSINILHIILFCKARQKRRKTTTVVMLLCTYIFLLVQLNWVILIKTLPWVYYIPRKMKTTVFTCLVIRYCYYLTLHKMQTLIKIQTRQKRLFKKNNNELFRVLQENCLWKRNHPKITFISYKQGIILRRKQKGWDWWVEGGWNLRGGWWRHPKGITRWNLMFRKSSIRCEKRYFLHYIIFLCSIKLWNFNKLLKWRLYFSNSFYNIRKSCLSWHFRYV